LASGSDLGGSGGSHSAPHHVPLPESPDAATVTDSSGNGHDGTVAGATLGVDGKYGKAAQFVDTSGSEIEIADDAALDDVTWHHVVLQRRGGTLTLWLDGDEEATDSATASLYDGAALMVGAYADGDGDVAGFFEGRVDG
jgi:hypothetical protein